jgi:hypothetical protein
LLIVAINVFKGEKGGTYLKFGPSKTLFLLDVPIHNMYRYVLLNFFIASVEVASTIISDVGNPILGFTIYNPDKNEIKGFGKLEIQVYANVMWLCSNLRYVLSTIISITQLDLAILRVIYSELASVFTIYYLLKYKKCVPFDDDDDNKVRYKIVEKHPLYEIV